VFIKNGTTIAIMMSSKQELPFLTANAKKMSYFASIL